MATLTPEEGETTVVFESDGTNRSFVAAGSTDCASLRGLISAFRLSVTPQNLRLDRAGDDSLTVSWDAPPNYPASGYDLQYRVAPATDNCTVDGASSVFCPEAMQVAYDSASPGSGVEITGLEPDTSYQVSVRARDDFPLDNGHFSQWARPLSAMTRSENSDPTGQPVIQLDGQPIGQTAPRVDDTLSVDLTGISDADGLSNASYAYRWLRAGTEIAMATGATYMVRVDDVGSALSVRVSFTDNGDNEEALTSATTAAVAAAPPVVTIEAGPDVVEGDTAVFTLRRTGDMSERLSVDYEVEVSVPDPTVPSSGIAILAPGSSELEVRISTSEDKVATSGHDITLTIVGGDGSSVYEIGAASSATVSVTDDDAAPRITNDTTSYTAPENSTDTIVGLAATDEDGDVLTWSIVGGADRDAFRLRTLGDGMGQVEELSFTEAQDFEAPGDQGGDGTYEVTVEVTDGFNPVTAELTIALTAAPPVVTIEAGPDVVEGDTAVFTLRRTGDMSERLSVDYEVEVSVPDPTVPSSGIAILAPGSSELEVRISTSEDKVATSGHDITLTIVGGDGSSVYEIGAASSATVSVTDDDAAPRITNDTTSYTAPENSTDTIVGLAATDEDGDVLTWSIVGGADRDAFRLRTLGDGMRQVEALSFTEAQDFEAPGDQGGDGTYEVTVEVTDGFNPVTAELTVALTAAPPVVTIEAGPDVVEGDTAVFTLRRSGTTTAALLDVNVSVSEDGDVVAPANEGTTTVAFGVGAATTTLLVATMDDTQAKEHSTVTVAFTPGVGYVIGEPASAAVPVRDNDEAPAALAGVAEGWLSRFGRTVSGHVSDAVWLRLRGEGKDSRVELAGRRLGPAAAGEGRGVARARWTGGEERMGDWPADDAPTPTVREVLLGSSFRVGLRDGGAPGGARWTSWGGASASRFDSEEDGLALDGEATTFIVGLDAARAGWLAGVALAGSTGEGEFGDRTAGRERRGPGKVASWLASVHPYARFAVSERLSVWGLLGHGTGDLELEADGAGRWKTDTSMAMAAAGARGVLLSGKETGGAELGIRADALIARLESDAATGEGGELAATRADTSRLRLMLEGSRPFALDAGGMIEPSLEAGVRHDGGDAETGTGVALGGGLRYHAPAHGLTVDTRIRGFIADGDTSFREWGASGSVRIRAGREGAGLSLTVSPAFGADSSGAARLWSLPDARGLAATGASEPAGRLDAELGYGLGARPGLGVVTPYAGLGLAGAGARAWRLGVRLRVAEDFTADLGATRCEVASDDAPEHGVTLRAKWRW